MCDELGDYFGRDQLTKGDEPVTAIAKYLRTLSRGEKNFF